MGKKKISMMQLRREPGEYIYHQVFKHEETIIVTHKGKEIAQICPIETTVIHSNGRIEGKTPLTYRRCSILPQETNMI